MVTKIINPTSKDIVFYTQNIRNFALFRRDGSDASYPPDRRVVKAGETLYSRSVTGDPLVEAFLTSQGCQLSRVRRSYIVVVAGEANAVGYSESPWVPDDLIPIPYAYFECLYPSERGLYRIGDPVPIRSPRIHTFQTMQGLISILGEPCKGIHRYLAEKLILQVPDDYELEIFGYSYGRASVSAGNVGSVNANNLPTGSTKWNSDGALTIAVGRRLQAHLTTSQPESKLAAWVWCQGEQEGATSITPDAYETGLVATMDKIIELCPGVGDGSKTLNGLPFKDIDNKHPLWVVYPGPQAYGNTQGTFAQIIAKQKELFARFVELDPNLATNNSNEQPINWQKWGGYGFTSAAPAKHYGDSVKEIGDKVGDAVARMWVETRPA